VSTVTVTLSFDQNAETGLHDALKAQLLAVVLNNPAGPAASPDDGMDRLATAIATAVVGHLLDHLAATGTVAAT
jgi:hypothetical protein